MADARVCALHGAHRPRNLTVESHHVIPVGWQLTWQPVTAPFPGIDPEGRGKLWDARTVVICPTGHRNVHHWIVQMMRVLAAPGAQSDDPAVAWQTLTGRERRASEAQTAFEALTRFAGAGGSLLALTAAGEWGQV